MRICKFFCTFAHFYIAIIMNMKKSILILVLAIGNALLAIGNEPSDMMHLLQGGYDAKILTTEEQDSLLAIGNSQSPIANSQSPQTRYRLEYENKQQLFRHSFFADYYLIDTQKNTRIRMCEQPVRDAVISPNGKYVVYAKADNNLYIYKIDFKTEVPITTDTNTDIFNGIADWLYEEEFGITRLFAFSPDSKMVAFVRLNETGVPAFEWQTFLSSGVQEFRSSGVTSEQVQSTSEPLNSSYAASYPQLHSLRYPRAGEVNAKASVCVYDIHYKSIKTMQLPEDKEYYVPRLQWGVQPAATKAEPQPTADLMLMLMNRDQTQMKVLKANAKSTVTKNFYEEESKQYYVNFELFDEWQWLQDGRVIVLSEKNGWMQAYLYSAQGMEQKCLTPEARDVMRLYGFDEKTQTLYYLAAPTPLTRQAYAYNLRKATTTQLTTGEGTHALTFSKDWKQYIDCYQSLDTPNRYTLYKATGNGQWAKDRVVLHNDSVAAAWQATGLPNKEFLTITTERGDVLNAWRVLPVGFDENKKYPVVMMQYSGPSSQRVTDTWRKRFAHYLAAQGYLVVCADPRGTHARGRAWRNATYMQLGQKEAEDQISVAKYLKSLPYVDGDRIALCGWSYGGYQTLMCMSTPSELSELSEPLFKCGIAIAPVTSWRLYDSAYTERYMRRPQVNDYGYEGTDLMKKAAQLQGKLLLVHGLADDNVHAQQSWLYVNALVQAGKQFEMQFYPDDNHFLRNGNNYEHLHKRVLGFLDAAL